MIDKQDFKSTLDLYEWFSHTKKKFYYAMGIDTLLKLNKIKLKWRNEKKIFPYNKCVLLNRKCQWTMHAIEILFIYHWNCVMIFFAIIHLLEYWHLKSVYLLKLKRRAHFLPLSCQGIYNVTNLQSNLVDRKSLDPSSYDASNMN